MLTIENTNGNVYTLIGEDGDYSFLHCQRSGQYVVAWRLHEVGEGLYAWEQGHYYKEFLSACDCFVKKCEGADERGGATLKNSKSEMWAKYLRYLCEWVKFHEEAMFYGMSPSCFDDWLCNERQEQGVCPKCGETSLDYDGGAVVEADYVYNWTCQNCGAVGKEHYSMTFEEHTLGDEGKGVIK